MQWKLSRLSALLTIVSTATALVLDTPTTPVVAGEELVIVFQAKADDPLFTILLVNHRLPGEATVVVTDVTPRSSTVAAVIPCLPSYIEGWFFSAVNTTNYNQIFATTATFPVTRGENCGGK